MTNNTGDMSRTILIMRSLYFAVWAGKYIGQQYMAIFLREFTFIDNFFVGMIMSVGYLVSTVSQLSWGYIADHSRTKNKILIISIIGFSAGILLLILPGHTSLGSLLAGAFLFYIFIAIPGLLSDSIIVENASKLDISFGIVKCFSSAGAGTIALFMFLLSFIMIIKPSTGFTMAFFTTLFALIPARFLPPTKGHAYETGKVKNGGDTASLKTIIQNRRLVMLLIYILLLFIAVQATNVYMGIYYATEEGMNAGLGMYGLFHAICIALETGFMLFGNRYIREMNAYHVFTLVGFAACFRSLILFIAPNIYVIQLSAIGHMLIFAPLWTRLAPYVNDIVPKELQATGQAAWYMMAFGLGPMIGAAFGGVITSSFGVRYLFFITASILFILSAVFFFLFRQQEKQEKLNPC